MGKTKGAAAKAVEIARGDGLGRVPDNIFAALADRLERALTARERTQLESLEGDLSEMVRELARVAPDEVKAMLRSLDGGAAAAAFTLGRASFAQLVAARAFERRADGRFMAAITDQRFEKYIRALAEGRMNGKALEARIGETEETVSRKLAILRSLGIVETHREKNSKVNVLTPAAFAAIRQVPVDDRRNVRAAPETADGAVPPQVRAALDQLQRGTDRLFNGLPHFGGPKGGAVQLGPRARADAA